MLGAMAKAAPKPSAVIDTRVIYCGDNLEQLKKLPDGCVDLLYIVALELERVALRRNGYQIPESPPSTRRDPWCLPSVQIMAGMHGSIWIA
jgi:hypothetical protein